MHLEHQKCSMVKRQAGIIHCTAADPNPDLYCNPPLKDGPGLCIISFPDHIQTSTSHHKQRITYMKLAARDLLPLSKLRDCLLLSHGPRCPTMCKKGVIGPLKSGRNFRSAVTKNVPFWTFWIQTVSCTLGDCRDHN